MFYTLTIVLVFCLIGHSWGQSCPNGSILYTEEQVCIYPVNAAAVYQTARVLCVQLGGSIFEIKDCYENTMAQAQAITVLGRDSRMYIGVVRGTNNTWIYDDGQPLVGQPNWEPGQPTTEGDCVTMNVATGLWKTEYCTTSTNFVCSMPASYTKCLDDWVGYKGSCYFIHDADLQTMNGTYNASSAAAMCRTRNAYLASIHSEDEFLFIKSQIATSRPNDDCRQSAALIGLTCIDSNYIWQDFTPFNFDRTQIKCSAAYTIMNDPVSCPEKTNIWNYWDDYSDFYRYICKKRSSETNILGRK